ncbi:universal stress protein [Amycolatopsis alba]|uniref:Universal stress protein n=1 Tax=Amycolatopsis alba DSM 44262 TaxID=1125972 RepID=A0A229RG99_AMYAL|nr:universal stress protein [Amycolatopsis alba]OXM45424.1 universal stress protein [Amycolatopsis alba DSM 44262]
MPGHSGNVVVVGVDGSTSATMAVRWAAKQAQRRHAELRLVHAIDDESLGYPRALPTRENLAEMIRMRGHRLLRQARDAAKEVATSVQISLVLRHEKSLQALEAMSEDASLLVLGTEGIRPLGRLLVGSVSIALAARAACPVALVRPHVAEEVPPELGPVVVGVDGSPASETALALAFEEASWRNATLVALHCWDDAFLSAIFEETQWTLNRADVEEQEREVLSERLAGWREKYPDVGVERVVVRGRPADELLKYGDRAQVLVVGSRGRGGVAGMLLGSTSQAVMSYALCPVVVARPAEEGKR